jgi:DNA-binding SARP family transcriptional activator
LLVIHANRTLSAQALIDELWGERPPSSAAKTLQAHISRLRKALEQGCVDGGEGVIVTREHGYELRVDREMVDSLRFERLLGDARSESAAGCVAAGVLSLEEALSLWRGPPLAEFGCERFAEIEIARLDELRLGALEDLIDAKLGLGPPRRGGRRA